MVELGLIGPVFCGLIAMMFIIGIWIYNSSQTAQAARIAAHYLAVTGNVNEAQQNAQKYINKTKMASTVKSVSVHLNGDTAYSKVTIEMETFFPGLPKLFNSSAPNWTGKVPISKEAMTTVEYRLRTENRNKFN